MSELKVLIKPIMDKAATKRARESLSGVTAKAPTARASGAGGMGVGKGLALLGIAAAGVMGILSIAKKLVDASPMLQGILQLFKNALNLFLMPIGNMIAMWLQPLAMSAMRFSMQFNKVFGERGFWGAMSWALQTVVGAWAKTVISFYSAVFAKVVENVAKLGGVVTNAGNMVRDSVMSVVREIMKLPSQIAKSIKGALPSAPSIPSGGDVLGGVRGLIPFAKGGIVTGPTPALVGEAGPEAIIPLDKLQQGLTIQFTGTVYGMRDFEAEVRNIVNRYGNRRPYA